MRLRAPALWMALLGMALPGAAALAAAPDQTERLSFTTVVTVEADGDATVQAPEGVQGPLAGVVRDYVAGLPYRSALRDGKPVASTIMVDGDVVLIPAGDDYEIAFANVRSQPLLLSWRPADFPRDALRGEGGGVAEVTLDVGADGKVAGVAFDSVTNADFAREVRKAVQTWRFQPPVAGERFVVGATFWFHGNFGGPSEPAGDCVVVPQGAYLPGDNGCLRTSETTGERRERGTPRVPVVRQLRLPAPLTAVGYSVGSD